jgi:hypothetical protein
MDRVTLIALLFSALGCKHVDGGAVEASWVLVTSFGQGISDCSCTCPPIAKIRMELLPKGDGADGADVCAGRSACEFSCNQGTGSTQFDIPPGKYQVRLVPVGADGADATGSEAGGCRAEGRAFTKLFDVVAGGVTQLDALEMVAGCAPECGGDDNTKVCTK